MGAHFRPGGAFPFLGLSAYELGNMHIDLATIWGRQAEEIRERLAVASSSGHRFDSSKMRCCRDCVVRWNTTLQYLWR